MSLLPQFIATLRRYHLPAADKQLLLAVSGGLDSVVLCHLCKDAGIAFSIAHCNFGLRGEESHRDEAFVKALAEELRVPFYVAYFNTTEVAAETKTSIQVAARNLRYQWFSALAVQHHFAYTLLAHHADDNVETALMNFFRGTGLDGLTGMEEMKLRGTKFLRPLLNIKREEIQAYANEKGIQWVEDSSNADSKYTRNFIRNQVLPLVKSIYPKADENITATINRLRQTATLYHEVLASFKKKFITQKGEEWLVPVLKLTPYIHTSLPYELIKDFGFGEGQLPDVLRLLEAESGRYIANETYRIIRHRKWLIVSPLQGEQSMAVIEKDDDRVVVSDAVFYLKKTAIDKWKMEGSSTVAGLDAAKVDYPLIIRRWKAGDYFYPLGMKKKKKVARFFIDARLSKTAKEKVWVIESHKRIIWVAGHRIDDRFKVTETTRQVVLLTIERRIAAGGA